MHVLRNHRVRRGLLLPHFPIPFPLRDPKGALGFSPPRVLAPAPSPPSTRSPCRASNLATLSPAANLSKALLSKKVKTQRRPVISPSPGKVCFKKGGIIASFSLSTTLNVLVIDATCVAATTRRASNRDTAIDNPMCTDNLRPLRIANLHQTPPFSIASPG